MNGEDNDKNIAVIGDSDFTAGFRLAGVKRTYNPEDYSEKVNELLESDDLGIVVVREQDLSKLSPRMKENVQSSVDPVVVTLSESAESEMLQDKIKKAIGADIT